jgi:hypothetical protein
LVFDKRQYLLLEVGLAGFTAADRGESMKCVGGIGLKLGELAEDLLDAAYATSLIMARVRGAAQGSRNPFSQY